MRLFVALPLPETYQQGLADLTARLSRGLSSRVSWTRPGNWHLTLKFLGEVPEDQVKDIEEVLQDVSWDAFILQAGGGGFFPDARRPRVVWTELIQGRDEATGLAQGVEQALELLGFAPDKRPFRAHLTLGRVKKPGPDKWDRVLETIRATRWPPVQVKEFALFQSELRPDGPRYTRLASLRAGFVEGRGATPGDQR